jgi:diguanylate cyclase
MRRPRGSSARQRLRRCIARAGETNFVTNGGRRRQMKTKANGIPPKTPRQTNSLAKVLGQAENVKELVKESAEELSSVNTVIRHELAGGGSSSRVKSALDRNHDVEDKVNEASEKLTAVNRALAGEVRERDLANLQLAAAFEQEAAARHAALHDVLTGLPNRVLFGDRLEHGLVQARRHQWSLAVMFVDLDKFKNINDTYGHDVGDIVIQTAATRLRDNARGDDTVSRHGGDEFLFLLTEIHDEKHVAMVARKIIQALKMPCKILLHHMNITLSIEASIGIAIYPKNGTLPLELVERADFAMYEAKRSKSGYAFAQ